MKKKLIELSLDAACLAGVSAVVYGVTQIHPPTAYIVAGLCVSVAAILRARRWDS